MNIVVCGQKGTGKTTLCKRISSELNFKYISDFDICGGECNPQKILDFENNNDGYVFDLLLSVRAKDCKKMQNAYCVFLAFAQADERLLQEKMSIHGERVTLSKIRRLKAQGKKIMGECGKSNIPFFDIDKNRDEMLSEIFDGIKSKVKSEK